MPMPDPNQILADWSKRGFSCEIWTDPPGQCWEDFRHETDELVVVLAGEIHHPKIGAELLIPAGTIHSARNIGKTTANWLYGYKRR